MQATDIENKKATPLGPALVVAGMHRSGTSAMARVLSLAGGSLPERVINPGPDNPLGFWEPWEMVALSDEILSDVGSSWNDIFVHAADAAAWSRRDAFLGSAENFLEQNFAERPLPVIKDPRASVLTRLWRQALINRGFRPTYVIMVRHPLEVAGSLAARDGLPTEQSLLVWAAYMLAVERDTRGEPRVFVAYPDLLSNWRNTLDRVQDVLRAPLPHREPASSEIDDYLSGSHRHHEAAEDALAQLGVLPVIETVYNVMRAAAAGEEPDPAVTDEAALFLDRLSATLGPIRAFERSGAAEREAILQSDVAGAEARLLRARAKTNELEVHLAEQEAASLAKVRDLETSLTDQTKRNETAAALEASLQADLRASHLSATNMQVLLDDVRAFAIATEAALAAEKAGHLLTYQHATTLEGRVAALEEEADEHQSQIAIQHSVNQALGKDLQELERDLAEWRGRAEGLTERIDKIKNSLGWKVARPIRVIEGRLSRAKKSAS